MRSTIKKTVTIPPAITTTKNADSSSDSTSPAYLYLTAGLLSFNYYLSSSSFAFDPFSSSLANLTFYFALSFSFSLFVLIPWFFESILGAHPYLTGSY